MSGLTFGLTSPRTDRTMLPLLSTHRDGNSPGNCDGLYLMSLEGEHKGHLQQFLSVPAHAERSGPVIEWDDKVIFSAVRHPGEADGATTNVASRFPYRGNTQPDLR